MPCSTRRQGRGSHPSYWCTVGVATTATSRLSSGTFEGLRDYDPTEAAGGLAVPGVYIAADELQPRSDMARFHEMFSDILYGKTVGSGHFCQLDVPGQVNAMIERFLAITLPR